GVLAIDRSDAGGVRGTTLTVPPGSLAQSDTYSANDFDEPLEYTARVGSQAVFHITYDRDAGGRIRGKTESILNPSTGATEDSSATYTYDDAGRLACVRHNGHLVANHTYDENGNRTGNADNCGPEPSPTPGAFAAAGVVKSATIGMHNRLDSATIRDAFGV